MKCVVLNACYSEAQANAISQHIDYVVGMKKAIGDEAAIKFAVGFYDALGAGRDFETAYKFGCSAIDLKGIPEYLTPVLKKKSISVTVPTPPSSASPPDASSAGLPGPQSGVHSPSVPGSGTATVPDGDLGKVDSAAGTSSPTSATAKITGPIRLFYSYSHKDEELRKELENHLSLLRRKGRHLCLARSHDRGGRRVEGSTRQELGGSPRHPAAGQFLVSRLGLLLRHQHQRALDRHVKGEATVIPILLRPVDWEGAPFARLQGLPIDLRPVTTWTNKDEAFKDIAQGIRRAIEGMRHGTR